MRTTTLAPVCLFVYKRMASLQQTIRSLLANPLALTTNLYIFSDAARGENDVEQVNAVRGYLATIKGFQSVTIHLAEQNKGLAESIIDGVSLVLRQAQEVIVLEDDLVVADNFLAFMNRALEAYRNHPAMFAVSGYSSPVVAEGDVYFTMRSSSWGWATWRNRWEHIDWSVADYDLFINDAKRQRAFNAMGSDLTHMLNKQMGGVIHSWAIRWVYHQFKHQLLTVFPVVSKVKNIGFHSDGTHTGKSNEGRFDARLDESGQVEFEFPAAALMEAKIIRQFVQPYSIQTRVIYKIKSLLHI